MNNLYNRQKNYEFSAEKVTVNLPHLLNDKNSKILF